MNETREIKKALRLFKRALVLLGVPPTAPWIRRVSEAAHRVLLVGIPYTPDNVARVARILLQEEAHAHLELLRIKPQEPKRKARR